MRHCIRKEPAEGEWHEIHYRVRRWSIMEITAVGTFDGKIVREGISHLHLRNYACVVRFESIAAGAGLLPARGHYYAASIMTRPDIIAAILAKLRVELADNVEKADARDLKAHCAILESCLPPEVDL